MTCNDPGAVTPEDLVAYAEGDGDSRTAAHVASCPWCAAEAASYAALDRTLTARLWRAECPATLTLGEHVLDLLDPQGALAVRAHVAVCPHCTAELDELRTALGGDPLAELATGPGLLTRLVMRLVPAPGQGLAFAGVRGAGSATRTYEADHLTTTLTVEPEPERGRRRWSLAGLVLHEGGEQLPAGIAVRVVRAGTVAAEATLDDLGNFVIGGLEDGIYDLELDLPDRVLAVEGLEIGPAGA